MAVPPEFNSLALGGEGGAEGEGSAGGVRVVQPLGCGALFYRDGLLVLTRPQGADPYGRLVKVRGGSSSFDLLWISKGRGRRRDCVHDIKCWVSDELVP
jgi:hypothetical protein